MPLVVVVLAVAPEGAPCQAVGTADEVVVERAPCQAAGTVAVVGPAQAVAAAAAP